MPYSCQVSWLRFCDLPFGPAIHLHNSWTGLPVVSLRFVSGRRGTMPGGNNGRPMMDGFGRPSAAYH